MFVEFFRRRWVPIRVENIFDADEKEDPILEGQLISTARSIRVGVGALRVEQPKDPKNNNRFEICSNSDPRYVVYN